ncbi:exodeoxyribonuclease VII large subunit [Lyngbya confervoides]|uniref:Exodeoxyribonuclease 7 large subunit n=1 Tax=Lyngbya confervoides BDU141951 TaxID=1574623 RepID=A0ABD4T4X3_9CYAN|nr:exodeoxyribonuclease VII large subunit [Lyngbya confervoides]MCM1983733.1 exodeoxyribonuclease VII large subunit [Lyngbya confervoides BDU141951]
MATFDPHLLTQPEILSVGGLTQFIQALLEEDPHLVQVWVTGEVSSLNHHRSGLFFTLRDPETPATLRCVIWTSYQDKVVFLPEQGEQVIVLGRIRLYPQRGEYQLMVWQVLQAGEGLMALRLQQLRDRLKAEGLFDPERKIPLPAFPQTIAVVTSPAAAAWGDIQRTLKASSPGLRVLLSPTMVQGDLAPPSIVRALERVEADGRAEVIILARGGGASEDLACFNDEQVVRAIAHCSIPIIAGIGHQRDESLADLAADCCAHTPTAAAELAAPRFTEIQQAHQERRQQLYWAVRDRFDQARQVHRTQCLRLQRVRPDQRMNQEIQHLQRLRQTIIRIMRQRLSTQAQYHRSLHQQMEALDPHAILNRGYALARTQTGELLRVAHSAQVGQSLTLQLAQGTVQVQVTAIESP